MKQTPLVSVIIPAYNAEDRIKRAVDSVLSQSMQKTEVIIVDDGSSDDTYRICEELSKEDDRIRLLKKENGGASSARNAGIDIATGDYIYFVDSDDELKKGALEALCSEVEGSNVDCVICEADNETETDGIKVKKKGFSFRFSYPVSSGEELIPKLVQNRDYHAAPFLYFFKRSALKDLRFEEGIMFEDELFSFRLLKRCERVLCLRQSLYRRYMREGSVMTSEGKGFFRFSSISRVTECLMDDYNDDRSSCTKKYLHRICLQWFNRYDELSMNEKKAVEEEHGKLLDRMKEMKFFGIRELSVRSKSMRLWFLYTMPARIIRKVRQMPG